MDHAHTQTVAWRDCRVDTTNLCDGFEQRLSADIASERVRLAHASRVSRQRADKGKVDDGILTVRFTYRGETIRIIGAGYWRKGRRIYATENQI